MKVMILIDPSAISYLSSFPSAKNQSGYERQSQSGFERQLQVGTDYREYDRENHRLLASNLNAPSTGMVQEVALLTFDAELKLVDAFFTNIQPLVTILDAVQFRAMCQSGKRHDNRWTALMNTVLALGSIAIRLAGDTSHSIYYQRAQAVLGLEYFAQPHLESIQTLGLIAGYYLHFVSQPNLAYPLMGVAIRMAAALGLHKEPFGLSGSSADLRRRVWWSLFCMDTFSCMTLGRPTSGRCGPSIIIKLPTLCGNDVSQVPLIPRSHWYNITLTADLALAQRSLATVNLVESTRFCIIATQIQEALATSPRIRHDQVAELDKKLVDWYEQLPLLLASPQEATTAAISTIQTNIQWRYLNSRMLLYRPALLDYAMGLTLFSTSTNVRDVTCVSE
ncbi:fungal-specific transcription factor domain-containing protein [Penicillium longicatenatum]|nr:fungal-specific transcription factor domain-containing protein [Penicillium longicatenatum]